jgi:ribonuclease PH
MRKNNRDLAQMRPVFLGAGFSKNAHGSCFVKFGDTHVLCTATIDERVPPFLRNTGSGWVSAEYGMLPCSSQERIEREAVKGKQTGRTQEIQRLISRNLRTVVDLKALGERQIKIDCDVLQADGGTRTASITGAYVALHQALGFLVYKRKIKEMPLTSQIAAISCGIVNGQMLVDLDYDEDSSAEVDGNFMIVDNGDIAEIKMCAEKKSFSTEQLKTLLDHAMHSCKELFELQKQALEKKRPGN